jgi:hypothetical protein
LQPDVPGTISNPSFKKNASEIILYENFTNKELKRELHG